MFGGLHNRLAPYVQAIADYEFGLKKIPGKVNNFSGGKIATNWDDNDLDRISLKLPYGNTSLKWEIIFNSQDLTAAPDVIAEDGFFESMSLSLVKEKVPILGDWCHTDQRCLLNFILQLLDLYQSSQIAMLTSNENLKRYAFEYETLVSTETVDPADLEVSVQPSVRGATVEFFIALKLDLSDLPLPVSPLEPARAVAILAITYRTQAETTVDLQMWSALEELIVHPQLPILGPQVPLIDYVPDVKHMIREQINAVRKSLRQKQHLFCALAAIVEPALLDTDSELYSKLSFLLECEKKQVICCVDIPACFPAQKPTLTFFKMGNNDVAETRMSSYPFNPKWKHDKMARCIVSALMKEAFGEQEVDV